MYSQHQHIKQSNNKSSITFSEWLHKMLLISMLRILKCYWNFQTFSKELYKNFLKSNSPASANVILSISSSVFSLCSEIRLDGVEMISFPLNFQDNVGIGSPSASHSKYNVVPSVTVWLSNVIMNSGSSENWQTNREMRTKMNEFEHTKKKCDSSWKR